MVSDEFIQLQNKLESLIKSFGRNYNFLILNGKKKKDGGAIKCIIIEVNGQNYLQIDSDTFIAYHELFPRTKFQKAIYHCGTFDAQTAT